MRKLIAALVLVLVGSVGWAQDGAYIRYHGPAVTLTSAGSAFFPNGIGLGNVVTSPYANLYGDAANTLALRNGGTAGAPVPQTFNIYNFCDGAACATGYERGSLYWTANTLTLESGKAGTGTGRDINIYANGVSGNNFVRLTAAGGVSFSVINYSVNGPAWYPSTTDSGLLGRVDFQLQTAYLTRSIQGSKSKTLTDAAAAVSFVRIAVPTNGNIGGSVIYTATSTDGTDMLTRQGEWAFAGADTAGTVTCGVGAAEYGSATAYRRGNTLVCTMSAVTATTNCDLQITCTDDKAAAQTVVFYWRLNMPLTATVTPQ